MTAPPAGALEACLALLEPAAAYGRGCNVRLEEGEPLYTADQMREYALLAALRLREGCEGLVAATHESAAGDMAQCKDEHGAFKSDSHRMAWNFAAGRFEMADDLARVLEQTK